MNIKLSDIQIRNEVLGRSNKLILLSFRYKLLLPIKKFIEFFLGIRIPKNSHQKRLRLIHPFNIGINPNAKLGNNITVYRNVSIGSSQFGKRKGAPKIANNVIIYTSAIITGNITIGENSIIGPGSVCTKDIPSNEIWVGNPARFISKIIPE